MTREEEKEEEDDDEEEEEKLFPFLNANVTREINNIEREEKECVCKRDIYRVQRSLPRIDDAL